jgi:MYXO-CTERM domain-containing protein
MKWMRLSSLALGAAMGLSSVACGSEPAAEASSANIEESVPDYHLCTLPGDEPILDYAGSWGEVGAWCDPAAMTDIHPDITNEVIQRYPGLIVRHRESPWDYRKPVIAKLVKVMAVTMHISLEERGLRGVWSQEEVAAFTHALLANAYQESFFSQYKLIDGQLRLMRSHQGHAHGLMQIFDVWHGDAVWKQNVGWDLLSNLKYGTDFFLDKWELSKQAFAEGRADCIGAEGVIDMHALARGAWSVYNGGNMGEVCRWTDPNDTWADNDISYEEKWQLLAAADWSDEYDWITAYPQALIDVDHIDFLGILGLASLPPGTCGDSVILGDEACDDGDSIDGDGCSSLCAVEPGFSCGGQPSACAASCGDGLLAPDEACDDANTIDGDGCNAGCGLEHGYACEGAPSVCASACGDGLIADNESCDDGNDVDADGCSTCSVDPDHECAGEPSVCVPNEPPLAPPEGQPPTEGAGAGEPGDDPYGDDPGSGSSGWDDDDYGDDDYDDDYGYQYEPEDAASPSSSGSEEAGSCAYGSGSQGRDDAGWLALILAAGLGLRRRRD